MITFILNVNDDQQPAIQLVKQIRKLFDQIVIVVGDGVQIISELYAITKAHSFDSCNDRKDGFWSYRYLNLALQTPAATIIKLDQTTVIERKFIPPNNDWFGTASIEGFSRSAAEKAVRSGLLLKRSTTSCQKQIMGKVMKKLGITLSQWNP